MAYQWKFLADLRGAPGDVSLYGPAWAPTRNVPADADLNTFRVPGIHRITTPDTATILNLPPGTRVAAELENITPGTGTDAMFSQRVTELGEGARKLWRSAYTSGNALTPWALDGVSGVAVTEWHVFLAVGQSNMSGRGIVSAANGGKYMQSRIAQFGFTRRVVETATVPLDMHDTASGLSPASVFANNYLRTQPDNVGVIIVAAAHGGTGFTTSTAGNTWSPNVATNPAFDLPQIAVDQTMDAIAAAQATGASVDLKAILFHQGENNSTMSQVTYASNLDGLIGYFRTEFDDEKLAFIVGQMVPEGIAANAGRSNIDIAHQDTPNRVPYTGFAAATTGGHNPGDTTHMSEKGVAFLGRTYLEAYEQVKVSEPALAAVPGEVARYITEDPTVIQAAADLAANNADLVAKWRPNTAYIANQQVVSPDGDNITRTANGSTGATFTMTNWAPSATAAAVAGKISASEKGAANGVATLDSGSKVPVAQLPAATTSTPGTQSAADKTKIDGATASTSNDTVVKRNSTGVAAFSQVQIDNDPVNSFHGARKAYVDAQDALKVAKGELAKNVRDYKGVGDPDDTLAIAAAHTANPAVYYPDGDYSPGASFNLYSGTYTNAMGPRWQSGRSGAPTADARPVMWVQKNSSATRTTNPSEWDNGAIYGALIKDSGSAYGAGITGYVRHGSADGGQLIGIHGRGQARVAQSEVWGMWSYVSSLTGTTFNSLIGHEINVNSKTPDIGWQEVGVAGQSRGLVVVTADGSEPITHGIYVGNNSAAPAGKMHSLIHLKGDAVVPSDAAISSSSVANNESIRIDGSAIGSASTGIRFRGAVGSTRFRTGITFAEATFENNAAILLADDQRIAVGAGPGTSAGLSFNKTTAIANFAGFTQIQVNGTKVLGARATGWGAASGTIDKTAWTTYVAPTVSATYVQAELQGVANRLMSIEQRVAALQQAATTHGQIGA